MSVFIGTFENKIDGKGRVSVPAQFRRRLEGQSFHGIVAFPSHREPCIEACGMDYFERMAESLEENYEQFSDEHQALSRALFGNSAEVGFDGDGRITLPPKLLEHANITGPLAFVGNGKRFQIWEQEAARNLLDDATAGASGMTLSMATRPRSQT